MKNKKIVKKGNNLSAWVIGCVVSPQCPVVCVCVTCKEGQYNLCEHMLCHATPPQHGSLTQLFIHPKDFTFKLPDNLTDEEGAMIEPLSVSVYAVQRSGVTAGSSVMVTGCGPIGFFQTMVSKAVLVLDTNCNRLKLAKSIGADEVIQVDRDMTEDNLV
ncbi:unnamed protein product [Medioppia subpectinata]|uniref:Alcohol dehydrogenase-like N-terminal domain-containing protein n=1 Tax=Medioppia subpectinata TaxID=1979941 RepID=A0A7R9L0K9_9ACAR|nr:unnamed protein product [Medioppia subpectinata]CAG2112920.1 unnamed protein product [Medioppia subpectinata]